MSNFSANIQAILDTSKIPSQIKKIEKSQIVTLKKFSLDTSALPSQIQASLDRHKFKISLDGIKTSNIDSQMDSAGSSAAKKFTESLRKEMKSSNNVLSDSLKVDTLDNKMSTWLNKNSKAAKDFGDQIELLRLRLKSLYSNRDFMSDSDFKAGLKDIHNEFKGIQQEAISLNKTGHSLTQTFKKGFESISKYITISTVIYEGIEALNQMYQAVYDIDTAMTNLYKVTDETSSRYEKFLSDSADSAKDLGRTISSYVEQTANWSKLGYTLDQSEKLAKLSSIYANVAELDDATAVSDMVTAMKAFNIETGNAVTIVDSLNELGNTFAVSAGGLGEGLTRSASAMNAAGTDMYKTLAMLTGGSEITQNTNEFGNFLKTASMRIRGMKGELEALGEEVDESVDSISKVQTQILNLTHGKVNIFDDSGNFRDYYEIMEDIAEIFETLTSTEQASLSEILFGKQRGNQGQALIQAFQSGQVQKAYETALNSDGSAYKEQERWMESLEAKTQQFKSAFEELSMVTLNSDFLKGLIESGTVAVQVLSFLIDHLGLLGTALPAAGLAAFIKNFD